MCAICGIGFMKDHCLRTPEVVISIMSNLLIECQSNGRAATGLSVLNTKEAHVLRRAKNATHLVSTEEYKNFMKENVNLKGSDGAQSIIGHCRFPTKGDPSNHYNNHPIVTEDIIGIHNGAISNDDELFAAHRIDRIAEVDTEIIFALINSYRKKGNSTSEAIIKATSQLSGSYACALQDVNSPYALYLFRAFGPTSAVYFPSMRVVIFATNLSYIKRAVQGFNLGVFSSIDYSNDTGVILDLYRKKISKFDINVEGGSYSRGRSRTAGFMGEGCHVWPD
jgi:glucosamine 6-phosphate synthetase-like amidotransferase/phosphosugar isomerase protein